MKELVTACAAVTDGPNCEEAMRISAQYSQQLQQLPLLCQPTLAVAIAG
jgi:hypothetical protein